MVILLETVWVDAQNPSAIWLLMHTHTHVLCIYTLVVRTSWAYPYLFQDPAKYCRTASDISTSLWLLLHWRWMAISTFKSRNLTIDHCGHSQRRYFTFWSTFVTMTCTSTNYAAHIIKLQITCTHTFRHFYGWVDILLLVLLLKRRTFSVCGNHQPPLKIIYKQVSNVKTPIPIYGN